MVGRSLISSPVNTCRWRAFWTSTIGTLSPTTVTTSLLPDPHLRVDRRRKVATQLSVRALDRGKSIQPERDLINADRQAHNLIAAAFVRHRRPDLFDELRARDFHRDTREHAAPCVTHRSRNVRGLREGDRWHEHQRTRRREQTGSKT